MLALLSAAAMGLYLPAFLHGLPHGDSYYLNVVWASAFIDALDWSTPYPRWLPSLWSGAGGADFYFYAPLPFYLSAFWERVCSACDVEESIALAAMMLALIGGLGAYSLARALGLGRLAVVAGLFWVLSPYHVLDWHYRQAFGELAGAAFLPLGLLGLHALSQSGRWRLLSLATAAIALSHLPSLVIFAVSALVLVLTIWRPQLPSNVLRLLATGTLGLGLASVYWLPALWLLRTVRTEQLAIFDWYEAMLRLPPWDADSLYPPMWTPFMALASLCAVGVLLSAESRNPARWFVLVTAAMVFALITPISAILWEHAPASVIQFPWRFLLVADASFAIALTLLTDLALRSGLALVRLVAYAALGTALFTIATSLQPVWRAAPAEFQYQELIQQRATVSKWLGRSDRASVFTAESLITDGLPENLPPPDLPPQITLLKENSRNLTFRAACPKPCTVILPRSYWSQWELTDQRRSTPVPIGPSTGFPLIEAHLPAGVGEYHLRLQSPRIERVAWSISLTALLLLIWLGLLRRRLF